MLRTSVALIIFNRPAATEQVFAEIARAKPRRLFVYADGPRSGRPEDAERCAAARRITEQIDWECEVVRDYATVNQGPWRRIASGITDAFRQVEELIVLEDDCVPDPTFFQFCDVLLEKYRDDERVMHIAGTHLQAENRRRTPYSYSFSRWNICWGYATWRRAWKHFDLKVPAWPELRQTDFLQEILREPPAIRQFSTLFDQLYEHPGEYDGYDFAWSFACWSQNGLSILPSTTLIRNVGFGPDSTHFPSAPNDPRAHLSLVPMTFPLRHPPYMMSDRALDDFIVKTYVVAWERKPAPLPHRFYRRLRDQVLNTLSGSDPARRETSPVARWDHRRILTDEPQRMRGVAPTQIRTRVILGSCWARATWR